MWISLHALQKNHKIDDNIPSTRHDNFPKHVTIQKWYIKRPQSSINHPRVPKYILQQAEDPIWIIYTNLHRHH